MEPFAWAAILATSRCGRERTGRGVKVPPTLQAKELTQRRFLRGPALSAKEGVRFGEEEKLTGKTPVNQLPATRQ